MVKTMEETVEIPDGVNITLNKKLVVVKGKKGEVNREFSDPRFDRAVNIEKFENKIIVKTSSKKRKTIAVVGTLAAHIRNMIIGVTNGYVYKLKIFYVHFPITLEIKGKNVIIKNFLGEKSLRYADVVGNSKVEVKKDEITVSGINKENVGQTAANIEMACRLSGKDRRIFLDGIYITGWEIGE